MTGQELIIVGLICLAAIFVIDLTLFCYESVTFNFWHWIWGSSNSANITKAVLFLTLLISAFMYAEYIEVYGP